METKQRGSGWSINLVFNLYKIFGYKLVYYMMYPVTFFYFIFASNVKESLEIYYKHLNIKLTNKIYFEHLRIFAICMVDRFIAKTDPESYTFEYTDILSQKEVLSEGAILLYSHFGGWAASSSSPIVDSKINIVMKEALLDSIKSIETDIKSHSNVNIIDLMSGTLNVSIQIANALINNEIVVMMADRSANKKSKITSLFLNENASFNKNPFQIAYKTNKPLLVYFVVLIGIQHYKVFHTKINMDKTKLEDEAVKTAVEEYVKEYETIIKMYPNQWLNFYNFWEKNETNNR